MKRKHEKIQVFVTLIIFKGERQRIIAKLLILLTNRHEPQNSPYFCVFKFARAVKQKVWNETRFTDFFTDFEKTKNDCLAV